MKKIIIMTALALVLSVATATPMFAQSNDTDKNFITWSVGAGVTFTNSIIGDMPGAQSNFKPGAYASGTINFNFRPDYRLEGNVTFDYNQSEFSQNNTKGSIDRFGAQIGVMGTYRFLIFEGHSINVGVGPYTNIGLAANYKNGSYEQNLYKDAPTNAQHPALNHTEYGVASRIGYEFPCGIEVTAGYKYGINNISANDAFKLHPQTISAGLIYHLGK